MILERWKRSGEETAAVRRSSSGLAWVLKIDLLCNFVESSARIYTIRLLLQSILHRRATISNTLVLLAEKRFEESFIGWLST